MKILHVGKFYYPIEGGIESINRVVVDSLKGNSQRVISFNNLNETKEDDVDSISILRSATRGKILSQPISYRYFWDLRRMLKYYDPDIVHFHYPNPLVAIFLLLLINRKIKLIVHWHSDVVAQKKLIKAIRPLEHKLLRRANAIIATSENYRDFSEILMSYKEKVRIIPCSIDEEKFSLSIEDEKKILEIKKKYDYKPIIFFVGRHVEYKGIKYMLEAEKYIESDCVIIVGGSGPLTVSMKKEFSSKRIKWIGRVDDYDMKLYYHAASILAFPSITRNEAFGVVLAEAMCCQTPAVTFTIPGSGVNWVAPDNVAALEVANHDSKGFAAAIDKLIMNEELRSRLGENGKDRVMKLFSKEVVTAKYRNLYYSLFDIS